MIHYAPVSVVSSLPVLASQIFRVLSSLPDTIRRPSGEYAQVVTSSLFPVRVESSFPVLASQILRVLSLTPRYDTQTIWGIRAGEYTTTMPGECHELFSRFSVPDL